jgi:hypothetical protein
MWRFWPCFGCLQLHAVVKPENHSIRSVGTERSEEASGAINEFE